MRSIDQIIQTLDWQFYQDCHKISEAELAELTRFERLLEGYHYKRLLCHFIGREEGFIQRSKRTLIDHISRNRNLKHSLSWYITEDQALRFAAMLEQGNDNHQIELELIRKIFSEIELIGTNRNFSMIDIGCGTGETAAEILKLCNRKCSYVAVDGSPYFTFLSLERFARLFNIHYTNGTYFVDALRPVTDEELASLKETIGVLRSLDDLVESSTPKSSCNKPSIRSAFMNLLNRFSNVDIYVPLIINAAEQGKHKEAYFIARLLFNKALNESSAKDVYHSRSLRHANLFFIDRLQTFIDYGFMTNGTVEQLAEIRKYTDVINRYLSKRKIKRSDLRDIFANLFMLDVCLSSRYLGKTNNNGRIDRDVLYIGSSDAKISDTSSFVNVVGNVLDKDFIRKTGIVARLSYQSDIIESVDPVNFHINEFIDQRFINLFLGQTLGNFNAVDRKEIISNLYTLSRDGDYVLIGVELRPDKDFADHNKECDKIAEKYKDGRFFLDETIKLLGGNADALDFNAVFNHDTNSVEMFYRVKDGRTLELTDDERTVTFTSGEVIPAASSYKFGVDEVEQLCTSVGFQIIAREFYVPKPTINAKDTRPEYAMILVRK